MWTPETDHRELRAFLTLAEELHFGRTAKQLRLTHSRVSQLIRSLEIRVGARLFDRTSRRVVLTAAGERLLNEIADPYLRLQEGLARAHQSANGVTGTLRIGLYLRISAGPHMIDIVNTHRSRNPGCGVEFVNTGLEQSYLGVLQRREVDILATRLPLDAVEVTIGPILSRERRVLAVARTDPLAERESICYDDLGDRAVSDVPAFPREMMDAFVPPVTPNGRVLKRLPNLDVEDVMMRVALGVQVHPTVPSLFDHVNHPDVVSVPIRDLPPSETALVWLTANQPPMVAAFVDSAVDVLSRTELA